MNTSTVPPAVPTPAGSHHESTNRTGRRSKDKIPGSNAAAEKSAMRNL